MRIFQCVGHEVQFPGLNSWNSSLYLQWDMTIQKSLAGCVFERPHFPGTSRQPANLIRLVQTEKGFQGQLVQVPGSANCRHLQARSAHELRLLAFYIFRRSRNNQKNIIFMAHGNYVNSNFGVDKGNDIGSWLPPSLT